MHMQAAGGRNVRDLPLFLLRRLGRCLPTEQPSPPEAGFSLLPTIMQQLPRAI